MQNIYKQFILLVSFISFATFANAQITYYTGGSGEASNLNNWWTATNGTGTHPPDFVTGDDFIIQSGHSMTVSTVNWTVICNFFSTEVSSSITVSSTFNFIFSGEFEHRGNYTHNSTAPIDRDIISGQVTAFSSSTFTVGTNQIWNTGVTKIFGNLILNNGVTVTSTRTITLNGNLTLNVGSVLSSTLTVDPTTSSITNGGNFASQLGTGTLNIESRAGTPIPPSSSWAGTVNFTSGLSQTIVNGNYTNLNATNGDRILENGNTIRISQMFTAGGGAYDVRGSIFEYNGTSSQTAAGMTYNNLIISNTTATVSAGGNMVVGGTLFINANGILDMGTNTLSGALGTVSGTGTLKTQSTSVTPLSSPRTWSIAVEFNRATGGQTLVAGTYANLINSNTSGINTVSGNINITNSLSIPAGSDLDLGTNPLAGVGVVVTGTGTIRTQNTLSIPVPQNITWSGTVIYNSASPQTIVIGTYNNLTASGGNRILDNSNGTDIKIVGTFTPGSNTYTTTGSVVNFGAVGSQIVPNINPSYAALTISGTGTKTLTGNITTTGALILFAATDFLAINGNTLTLKGTTTMTGALKGSSTSNLTINGSAGGTPIIKFNAAANDSLINTLTLNRSGAGAGLTLGSNVAVTNLLSITSGELTLTGRIITLKSTSLTSTALVGPVPVAGTVAYGGTGSFTVERFIPTANRAYRDVAPGVNTNSSTFFFDSWQEGGSAPTGFGTHITGLAGASPGGVDATTGLDITQSGNATLYTYINGVFASVTNTKTTKPNVYQGYRVLIRGDRNVNLYQTPQPSTMNVATAIRANGQIVTGTVTYTNSGVTNANLNSSYTLNTNNAVNNFSLIGNPYVCLLDWESIVNGSRATNLTTTYTAFNGSINTGGAYATYDAATDISLPNSTKINRYIQPGQSFFVQNSAPNPQLEIRESDKATAGTFSEAFRSTTTVNKLLINLYKQLTLTGVTDVDGCAVAFIPTDNNGVDGTDAEKFTNGSENLAVYRANKRICIERRNSASVTDTIPLRLWQMSNSGVYSLSVDTRNFTSTNRAYIIDKFLNTEKIAKLNDTTKINFSVNTSDTTSFINRFFIVFRSNAALPLGDITLKASTKNDGVQIDFTTTNEVQIDSYEVEKSTNASSFIKLGTVIAKNGSVNNYSLFDSNPINGTNYYRVKIINQDGSTKYSSVVTINLNKKVDQVLIYPNPIKGNNFNLQLMGLKKGTYILNMYNKSGQSVLLKNIMYDGNIATQNIDWIGKKIASGNYTIVITQLSGSIKITKNVFIEN